MRIVGFILALALVAGGAFIALAGMGYIGSGSDTSLSWAMLGSLIAGLGVALGISVARPPHR